MEPKLDDKQLLSLIEARLIAIELRLRDLEVKVSKLRDLQTNFTEDTPLFRPFKGEY